MATEIVVPRLGWSMDEGTFVEWLKAVRALKKRCAELDKAIP